MNSLRQESELTCIDTGKSRNEVISDNDQLQIDSPSPLGCPIANLFGKKTCQKWNRLFFHVNMLFSKLLPSQ